MNSAGRDDELFINVTRTCDYIDVKCISYIIVCKGFFDARLGFLYSNGLPSGSITSKERRRRR